MVISIKSDFFLTYIIMTNTTLFDSLSIFKAKHPLGTLILVRLSILFFKGKKNQNNVSENNFLSPFLFSNIR